MTDQKDNKQAFAFKEPSRTLNDLRHLGLEESAGFCVRDVNEGVCPMFMKKTLENTSSVILMSMRRAMQLNDFETLQHLDEMYDRVEQLVGDIDALLPD
ncbi:hypothetical protein [Yoonia sp. R2-816]|uniref:hypothetical protein n=1 Tax=Yoonia sp. R2-816 TaxID=3342638 RepID=UPI00372C0439